MPPPGPVVEDVNMWGIDMTPLEVDGKYYAVWSGWDRYYVNREGNGQYLYIASMTFHDDYPKVRLGERVLLSTPTLPWELKVGEGFSLIEGPEVLRRGQDVFIVYSTRGSWTVNYKLGLLKLIHGSDPLDPASWVKKPEPVFQGLQRAGSAPEAMDGQWGVGHASFVLSPDDSEWWIYYHAKTRYAGGWDDRKVFLEKFVFDEGGDPLFGDPANGNTPCDSRLPMTRPSGEVAAERAAGVPVPEARFMNPVHAGADPWIVKHGGLYYTCRAWGGIRVTESPYMTRFVSRREENGATLFGTEPISWDQAAVRVWSTPASGWNGKSPWAPELHHIDGRWYIFYAAGRQSAAPYWEHRAGVLISTTDSPFGPYEMHDSEPLFTGQRGDQAQWTVNRIIQ
jgi:GH43 family beta-xylosidase